MRVLLLGMPDVASCFDRTMRFPNLGIASVAANITGAEVSVLDLVLHARRVGDAVRDALERVRPDVVGLSAMTFQYDTAKLVAGIVRSALPGAKTVLGGYHATLAYESIASDDGARVFDYLVRGEGEVTMDRLVACIRDGGDPGAITGLSHWVDGTMAHNPPADILDLAQIAIPARRLRMSRKFHYFGRPFDVVETSRGCPKACRFCSIRGMYGASHRVYPIERVIEDIKDARAIGARGVFFVDDNINIDTDRLLKLCEAIVEAGLDDMEYVTQADVAGFVREPGLPSAMKRAGFSGVFLGIESVDSGNWRFLRKKNAPDDTRKVVGSLRAHRIAVAGGFIIGNPEDDLAAVRSAFQTAKTLPLDHAIMWCLTPYPGTEARAEMLADGLVENADDFSRYNGFICNVRTRKLSHEELARAIATEGAKLYFSPSFFLRSRAWPRSPRAAWMYFSSVAEYLTRAPKNRLFASRHRV